MSALPHDAEVVEQEVRRAAKLALLPQSSSRLSTLGFFGVIGLLVALGLTVVMVTSTTVAAQSRELSALQREASELAYQAALLNSDLQVISSTSSLAVRAADLGMVPNPYPAFINLEDSTVMGEPTRVSGNEAQWLRVSRPYSPLDAYGAAAGVGQENTLPSSPVEEG